MRTKNISSYLSIIIIVVLFVIGCSSKNINRINTSDEVDSGIVLVLADTLSVSEEDSTKSLDDSEAAVELNHEWIGLTNSERLDSTAMLLEAAVAWHNEKDFFAVEFYFLRAVELIGHVDPEDPEIEREEYDILLKEIRHFYHNFIPFLDFLPEESSPEAVLAGIEIAEGDTIDGENGFLDKPEVSIDSTALDSVFSVEYQFPPVPLSEHKKVKKAIKFFQNKGRRVFTRWLKRAEYNVSLMQKILREEGLPEELVYLAMVESGFNPKAYSYAHAAGPWQFIRSTGRIFRLKIDWWYDERRDPVKSTYAAAKYLKKLYFDFEDWYLALAAYNCGEGKVKRHIKRYRTKDFWRLKRLPRQTRNYIPTYLAAMTIALNPTEYGFDDFVLKNPPPYDSVLVTECLDLKLIAQIVDTTYKCVKELNPAVVRWCTPPTLDSIWLKIPVGRADLFYEEMVQIPENQKRSWVRHKVRRGETLSVIARKYGTTMTAIAGIKSNKIRNRHKIREGQILLIPVPPHKYSRDWAVSEPSELYYPPEMGDRIAYVVRRGDNLSTIAEKYHTSVSKLKRWNGLYGKRYIYPGQKLTIWLKGAAPADNSGTDSYTGAGGYTGSSKFHRVKPGESLWIIAKKYGISLNELKRLNGLSGRCVIRSGDKLLLVSGDDSDSGNLKPRVYTVRRGDTLWDIAEDFGVRLKDLKRANNIDGSDVIRPGDMLKIPD